MSKANGNGKVRHASLTKMQQAFVIAYLSNGWNGVEAARAAGYGGNYNTLGVVAHQNLKHYKVKREIEAGMLAAGLSQAQVNARLAEVVKASLAMFIDKNGRIKLSAVRRYGHLVREYEPRHGNRPARIKLHDPLRAIEMAARIAGMFQDRVELSGGTTSTDVKRIEVVVVEAPKQLGNGAAADVPVEAVVEPAKEGNGK